jgi:hypothetical protein
MWILYCSTYCAKLYDPANHSLTMLAHPGLAWWIWWQQWCTVTKWLYSLVQMETVLENGSRGDRYFVERTGRTIEIDNCVRKFEPTEHLWQIKANYLAEENAFTLSLLILPDPVPANQTHIWKLLQYFLAHIHNPQPIYFLELFKGIIYIWSYIWIYPYIHIF